MTAPPPTEIRNLPATKICPECGDEKGAHLFYTRNYTRKDGVKVVRLQSYCIQCTRRLKHQKSQRFQRANGNGHRTLAGYKRNISETEWKAAGKWGRKAVGWLAQDWKPFPEGFIFGTVIAAKPRYPGSVKKQYFVEFDKDIQHYLGPDHIELGRFLWINEELLYCAGKIKACASNLN